MLEYEGKVKMILYVFKKYLFILRMFNQKFLGDGGCQWLNFKRESMKLNWKGWGEI